jgi:ABC-type multidrug transport system ATPase subunit
MRDEAEAAGIPPKHLGVTWNNLTVKGKASSTVLHDTVLSLFDIPGKFMSKRHPAPGRTILDESFGCVRPGQVLLILARPGGGATTLLKMIANQRKGFTEIEGDMHYGTMDHKQAESTEARSS